MLNSDRTEYNRIYGADNTYWMLQDNAMQNDWHPPPQPPLAQPCEWTFPYTVYVPEYDIIITEREAADANWRINEEWGHMLPLLLTAASEDEFDSLFESFLDRRWELGYDIVLREWARLAEEAKRRLGLEL